MNATPLPASKYRELSCAQCRSGAALDFDFSFAFQPVVDASTRSVAAYEALVRGREGEPALSVLQRVDDENRYAFDQACRVKAIALAARLGITVRLNINFFPNAIYRPQLCIRTTLEAAKQHNFPLENLTFEFLETERAQDFSHLRAIVESYRNFGFKTALDDFGTGHSGLLMLSEFQPDVIKIDRQLLQDVERNPARQAVVEGLLHAARKLDIGVVAEGVETKAEYRWLFKAGIRQFQGYYFARPGFEQLPQVAAERFDLD